MRDILSNDSGRHSFGPGIALSRSAVVCSPMWLSIMVGSYSPDRVFVADI